MTAFLVLFGAITVATGAPMLGVAAGMIGGAVSVWFFPWTKCSWCGPRGGPRRMDSRARNWHDCPVCKGSGKQRRLLTRVIGGVS